MDIQKILRNHEKYKDKTMDELIAERNKKLRKRQNDLRKKYLPERYDPTIDEDEDNANKK